jgi:hypothetical protein
MAGCSGSMPSKLMGWPDWWAYARSTSTVLSSGIRVWCLWRAQLSTASPTCGHEKVTVWHGVRLSTSCHQQLGMSSASPACSSQRSARTCSAHPSGGWKMSTLLCRSWFCSAGKHAPRGVCLARDTPSRVLQSAEIACRPSVTKSHFSPERSAVRAASAQAASIEKHLYVAACRLTV